MKKRAMKKKFSEIETIRARYVSLSSNDIDISLFDIPNTRQVLEDLEFLLKHVDSYKAGYKDGYADGYDDGFDADK